MSSTPVAVIGAGIAGPVLAMLLKERGYDPVIYERTKEPWKGGLSLIVQPNGIKVLQLIPGLLETLPGQHLKYSGVFSCVTNRTLVLHDGPSDVGQMYGSGSEYGMLGVQREAFHKVLIDAAIARGIQIRFEHHLERLEEIGIGDEQSTVRMYFTNGSSAEASFIVGCDGLHSNTRSELFGVFQPNYTGLVQTGGMSPRPEYLEGKNVFGNFLGSGAHMVAYAISPDHYSWALTQHEDERKESWRHLDDRTKEEFKNGPFTQWSCGAGDMVKTTTKLVKYGLYDRPSLKTWYKGRVVLLGDAAHPTTPHLGQGANQAFEDIYHLALALKHHHPQVNISPSTAQLVAAFAEYETIRIPRTSELVRRARERGAQRTESLDDADAIREREERWKNAFSKENQLKEMDFILRGPYEKVSEL